MSTSPPVELRVFVSGSEQVTLVRGNRRVTVKKDDPPPAPIVIPKPGNPGSGGVKVLAFIRFVDDTEEFAVKTRDDPTRLDMDSPVVNLDDFDEVLASAASSGEVVEVHVVRR